MSHLFFFTFLLLVLCASSSAQKRWDGEGRDGQWNNPSNWTNNRVPVPADEVVLDHSLDRSGYSVQLPAGNISVKVKTILISPGTGDTIELELPATNTAVPALVVTGPGYGMMINARGVFKNASGAGSGTPVAVADSIRINDGAKWTHATARAHAANIQALSQRAGTENGIFEFDVPDPSTTISLSGRTFGRLVLKAVAAGGTLNYTAAGTGKVRIRGGLEINAGVTCGLNFTDSIIIEGDYTQNGGVFNLGNTNRSVVLAVSGNIRQSATGTITETGTGIQEMLLRGTHPHVIDLQGNILNQIVFTLDTEGSAVLSSPLRLPYKLSLRKGILTTSATGLLHLLPACTIVADSLSDLSFINGPMKKDGLNRSDFLFPVGMQGMQRWVRLKNATGDFTIEYFRTDPYSISNSLGAGLDHISQLEYWSITGNMPSSNAFAALSFNDPHSGGVTALPNLRVARLTNGTWVNAGNTAFGGSAGSNGWVSSVAASGFSAGNNFFALASATGQENPLPLSAIALHAVRKNKKILFGWEIAPLANLAVFELEESSDLIHFKPVASIPFIKGIRKYNYELPVSPVGRWYYRIKAANEYGVPYFSRIVTASQLPERSFELSGKTVNGSVLDLSILSPAETMLQLLCSDAQSIIRKKINITVRKGISHTHINLEGLSSGVYYLFGLIAHERTNTFRFILRLP